MKGNEVMSEPAKKLNVPDPVDPVGEEEQEIEAVEESEDGVSPNATGLTPAELGEMGLSLMDPVKAYQVLVEKGNQLKKDLIDSAEKIKKQQEAAGGKVVVPTKELRDKILQGKTGEERFGSASLDVVTEMVRVELESVLNFTVDSDPWTAVALAEILGEMHENVSYVADWLIQGKVGANKKQGVVLPEELVTAREYLERVITTQKATHKVLESFGMVGMVGALTNTGLQGVKAGKSDGSRGVRKFPGIMTVGNYYVRRAWVKDLQAGSVKIDDVEWEAVPPKTIFHDAVLFRLNPLLGIDRINLNDAIMWLDQTNKDWRTEGQVTVVEFALEHSLVQFKVEQVKDKPAVIAEG